jgi:hypothetical protein
MFNMKQPPGTETVSTGVVTVLKSTIVYDQIVLARSEFRAKKGEGVTGDHAITRDANILQPEWFNFVAGIDGRCYGFATSMSRGEPAPRPQKRDGWLVLFVAPANVVGTGVWRPIGWYEEACFASSYQNRPEPELQHCLYTVSTQAKNAYVIPEEKRPSFPVLADDHFTRKWVYARSPFHSGQWRERLAELAEQIVSRKSECIRVSCGQSAHVPSSPTTLTAPVRN